MLPVGPQSASFHHFPTQRHRVQRSTFHLQRATVVQSAGRGSPAGLGRTHYGRVKARGYIGRMGGVRWCDGTPLTCSVWRAPRLRIQLLWPTNMGCEGTADVLAVGLGGHGGGVSLVPLRSLVVQWLAPLTYVPLSPALEPKERQDAITARNCEESKRKLSRAEVRALWSSSQSEPCVPSVDTSRHCRHCFSFSSCCRQSRTLMASLSGVYREQTGVPFSRPEH